MGGDVSYTAISEMAFDWFRGTNTLSIRVQGFYNSYSC